jgi:hypothetical protein
VLTREGAPTFDDFSAELQVVCHSASGRSRGSALKWREAFTAIVLAAGETTTLKSDPCVLKELALWLCCGLRFGRAQHLILRHSPELLAVLARTTRLAPPT